MRKQASGIRPFPYWSLIVLTIKLGGLVVNKGPHSCTTVVVHITEVYSTAYSTGYVAQVRVSALYNDKIN